MASAKSTLAERLLTSRERQRRIGKFLSGAWYNRRKGIAIKELRRTKHFQALKGDDVRWALEHC